MGQCLSSAAHDAPDHFKVSRCPRPEHRSNTSRDSAQGRRWAAACLARRRQPPATACFRRDAGSRAAWPTGWRLSAPATSMGLWESRLSPPTQRRCGLPPALSQSPQPSLRASSLPACRAPIMTAGGCGAGSQGPGREVRVHAGKGAPAHSAAAGTHRRGCHAASGCAPRLQWKRSRPFLAVRDPGRFATVSLHRHAFAPLLPPRRPRVLAAEGRARHHARRRRRTRRADRCLAEAHQLDAWRAGGAGRLWLRVCGHGQRHRGADCGEGGARVFLGGRRRVGKEACVFSLWGRADRQ